MRVLRPLAISFLTGVLVESACFKAPEDRDFGPLSAAGNSSDASSGGDNQGGGGTAGGNSGGAGKGGTGAAGQGGAGALPDGSVGDAADGGKRCTADVDCDNHDTCDGSEKCQAGICRNGTALANKTQCTVYVPPAADAGSTTGIPGLCFDGDCLQTCTAAADCDDKNACNGQESCDGSRGVCVQGVAPKCDDANDCTDDGCDPKTGACVNTLVDKDGDGHAPSSLGTCGDDCDDNDPKVYTGAAELCDGKDNDCNNVKDDQTPFWFVDCDGDGFATNNQNAVQQCNAPAGGPGICGGAGKWTAVAPVSPATQDCNDAAASSFPGNPEVCDNIDNDCSGVVDDVLPKKWADCDGDGFARANAPAQYACVYNNGPPPACSMGYWTTTEPVPGWTDCDDSANGSALNPYAGEDCANPDNVDNNCDGVVDGYRWFQDCDSDGYAAASATSSSVASCAQPMGAPAGCANGAGQWVSTYPSGQYADCDDTNGLVYPLAYFQTVQDKRWGWDYNCDGETSKQYTSTSVDANASCVLGGFLFPICEGADGWTGTTVPDCGQLAESSMCGCASGGTFFCNTCARTVSNKIAQGCR